MAEAGTSGLDAAARADALEHEPRLRAGRRRGRRPVPRRQRPLDLPRSSAAAPLPGRAGRARPRLPASPIRSAKSVGGDAARHDQTGDGRCDSSPSATSASPRPTRRSGSSSVPRCSASSSPRAAATARAPAHRRRRLAHRRAPWRTRRPRLSRLGRRRTGRPRGAAARSREHGHRRPRAATRRWPRLRARCGIAWFHDPFGFRHELSSGLAHRPASFRPAGRSPASSPATAGSATPC